MKVRAKKDVYLGPHGYHAKDEEFEYAGPQNKNLEVLEKSKEDQEDEDDTKYHAMTRDELKAELERRDIEFTPNQKDSTFRKLLEQDDDAKA